MKKILLIIALVLCMLQMVVLATAINIGSEAIDRPSSVGTANYTYIYERNPSEYEGTITSIEIWAKTTIWSCEVAIFIPEGGNVFSTRANATFGTITQGSKVTKAVSLAVGVGDYIGFFIGNYGAIEATLEADALKFWNLSGDKIPCTSETFSYINASRIFSIQGIGETEEEGANVIFFGMNF